MENELGCSKIEHHKETACHINLAARFYLQVFVVLVAFVSHSVAEAAMYQDLNRSSSIAYTDHTAQLLKYIDSDGKWKATFDPIATLETGQPTGIASPRDPEQMHVTVPVQRVGQLLVIQVYLNGHHRARLILDTGASHTMLSHHLISELGMASDASATTVTLNTAGGPVQAEMVKLAAIRIGEVEVHNLPVAIHDLPEPFLGVDGLLGMTFLGQFLITLDIPRNELHLRRHP